MSFVPTQPDGHIEQLAKGATLLLPAVSSGNVPQLTIDLLLATLPHTLLGCFHSAHVQACVGGDALAGAARPAKGKSRKSAAPAPSSLTTSLQLWHVPSLQLLVLQQRAPVLRGHHRALVSELLAWARGLSLAQIVLLTSSPAFRQGDEELDAVHPVAFCMVENGQVQQAASASASASAAAGQSPLLTLLRSTLQWSPLHHSALKQDEQPLRLSQLNSAEETEEDEPVSGEPEAAPAPIPVPGVGITRPFFEMVTASALAAAAVSDASSSSSAALAPLPPVIFLHVYVNEGANDRDAMLLAHNVYTLLFLQQQQPQGAEAGGKAVEPQAMVWTPPASWSSVFGNAPEDSLYL